MLFHFTLHVDVVLSPMQSEMASRLFAVLEQNDQALATLDLDGQRSLQIGLCSLHLQNLVWAENAFGSAHQRLPGNDVVLKGLRGLRF